MVTPPLTVGLEMSRCHEEQGCPVTGLIQCLLMCKVTYLFLAANINCSSTKDRELDSDEGKGEVLNLLRSSRENMLSWPTFNARD